MALVFVLRKCCCWVIKLCLTFCDPMDCSMPGFPVLHYLPELAQIHIHWVSDAIQPSHPLLSPSSPTLNLSQHQGLFQWVGSSHEVAKVVALQPQHQTFQWTFRVDILSVWLIWSPCCPRDSGESSPAPILGYLAFFMVQLSHLYMTTGKPVLSVYICVATQFLDFPCFLWLSFCSEMCHCSTQASHCGGFPCCRT